MPLYDYRCPVCSFVETILHHRDEEYLGFCDTDGAPLVKLMSSPPFKFTNDLRVIMSDGDKIGGGS